MGNVLAAEPGVGWGIQAELSSCIFALVTHLTLAFSL